MLITQIPFDQAQIADHSTIRAIIEVARGPKASPFATIPHAGSYGAVIWGRGEIAKVHGAGYAQSDDILRAHAVKRILEEFARGASLVVYSKGLEDQLRHVALSRNGRKRDGKTPFAGYDVLKPIQETRDAGRWRLQCFKARGEPEGYPWAKRQAEAALSDALLLQGVFSQFTPDHPEHCIIVTDADPDPDGILSRLRVAK